MLKVNIMLKMMMKMSIRSLALIALLAYATAPFARAEDAPYPEWPDEVVEVLERVPVLDEGRVKPLNTLATYTLFRFSHKRSLKIPLPGQSGPDAETRKIGPVEWFLDVLFFPEVARTYDCFLVETDEVLTEVGLTKPGDKKKRDLYSFEFLAKAGKQIELLSSRYHKISPKDRDAVQGGIVDLGNNMAEFGLLMGALEWASLAPYAVPEEGGLRAFFDGKASVHYADVVRAAPAIAARLSGEAASAGEANALRTAWRQVQRLASTGGSDWQPRFLPPTKNQVRIIEGLRQSRRVDPDKVSSDEWLSPYLLFVRSVRLPEIPLADAHLAMLDDLEAMMHSRRDMAAFEGHARSFQEEGKRLASELGKGDKVGMEVLLFRGGFLSLPKHFYMLAFVLIAISWAFPKRKAWYDWFVLAPAVLIPTLMLIAGIVLRSVIRSRPPMVGIYDTVLFITAFMAVSAIVVELIHKKRIALALVPVVGYLGMSVALGYEDITRRDTMAQVQAVLDTNFWLATHVTCIAIGYAAALLTAVVGNLYVLGKAVGFKRQDQEFYRTLGRMLYGMLAFGLIFATLGTILGGIWANDSWGRFWGWDPKENGALMIVLWQLAMVHGRLGGILKTWGLAMASAVLGVIVAFSWWGVNLLGIGLHSYGFTSGVNYGLNLYYLSQGAILLIGFVWWMIQRPSAKLA